MVKEAVTVNINKELYLQAKSNLEMSVDDFIEYSLSLYLSKDTNDEYARVFRQACKLYNDLENVKKKLHKLGDTSMTETDYSECIETINRIHTKLGYIGRNQIRKIAKNNNVSPVGLLDYVEASGVYDVRNFGDAPK